MPRTKGAKNRGTLIKEMEATGKPFTLPAEATYKQVVELHRQLLLATAIEAHKEAQSNAKPEPVRYTEVAAAGTVASTSDPAVEEVVKAATKKLADLALSVGVPVPQRVYDTLAEAYGKDVQGAEAIVRKATEKLEIHILALKANGKLVSNG